jgi:predicted RNase H-like HicB family nuclease
MKLAIILEPQEEVGFTAYAPSLKGYVSQGDTKKEAIKNIKEAIELYLEADVNELTHLEEEKVVVTV